MKTETHQPRPRRSLLLFVAALLVAVAAFGVAEVPGPVGAGPADEHADLIARMYEWRNDPQWVSYREHTDRWDRALLAFGETVADASLTPMTAAEAQAFADRGWERWVGVAAALRELEAALQVDDDGQAGSASQSEPPEPAGDGVAPAQQLVQAQGSAITLVSNLGKTTLAYWGTNAAVVAQGFTTGSAAGGYTLTSVELDVQNSSVTETERNSVRVELWSDSSGSPDSKLASLTVPASISRGTTSFAAPASTKLAKETTYHVVAYTVGSFSLQINATQFGGEDDGAAAGWAIKGQSRNAGTDEPGDSPTWTAVTNYGSHVVFKVAVTGTVNTETPTASTNANLSDLEVSGSTSAGGTFTALTLIPATFDSATTAYTASVANSITHVKVTPTVADTGKATVTVEGTTVSDGTASSAIALSVGSGNELNVVVTAEDGSTTKEYTVTVTRASASTPSITLSSDASSNSAAEGDSAVTITATLSEAAATGGVTVALAKSGTATETSDYTLDGTISITAGASSGTASLTIVDDAVVEANETVVLNATASGHTAGSLTVTIEDNDTAAKPTGLTVTARDAALGLSWTPPAGVLTGYDVHYTSAPKSGNGAVGDTATVRTDTNAAAGWVDASHSGTTASHSISGLTNGAEYRLRVRAQSAAGAGAWEFTTGTPEEPTLPAVALTVNDDDRRLAEQGNVTLTATLPEAAGTGGVTVTLSKESGSATVTDDYSLSTSTITIAEGATSGTANLSIVADDVDEDDETLVLKAEADGHSAGTLSLTIVDDDTAGVVIGDGTTITRTVEVRDTATYTVKLASKPTAEVKVTPSVKVASTGSDSNKATVSGELTFTTSNWNETQTVTITGVTAGTGLKVTHAVTNVTSSSDPKYPASLAIAEVGLTVTASTKTYEITATRTAAEGANASLTVTLGRAAPTGGVAFTVAYDYSGSTATAADTGTTPSTVMVSAGTTTATLTVPIAQDDLVEGPETFTVTVATNVSGWQKTGTGKDVSTVTISETENAKIAFGSNAAGTAKYTNSHNESAGASVPVTVSHLPQSSTTFTITLLTTGSRRATEYVDAANPGDFRIMTKSVTFGPATAKTQNLSITFTDDDVVEWGEIIPLRIADSASGLGAHYQRNALSKDATVTITDNEGAKIAFGSNAAGTAKYTMSHNEPDGATVPVTIDHVPQTSTTFEIEVIKTGAEAGTATEYVDAANPGDFRIATKSVTFGPGDTSSMTKNVAITFTNDALVENDQTIELRIKAADTTANDLGDFYTRHANGSKAAVTIVDDDARVAKAAFGNSAAATTKLTSDVDEDVTGGSLTVPITVSALPEETTTFNVRVLTTSTATEYVDASNPNDFRIATKSVTFGPSDSSTTKDVTVTINNDALIENDQTIELEIHSGTGFFSKYTRNARGKLAQATIADDDRDDAKIAFGDSAAATAKLTSPSEDEDVSGGKLNVPITVSALPDENTTFAVEVLTTGTATEWASTSNPGDFRIVTKSVTFGPSTSKTQDLSITLTDDALVEQDQTIELRIRAASDTPGTVGSYSDLGDYYGRHAQSRLARATIADDDRGEAKIAFGNSADATTTLTSNVDEEVSGGELNVPVTISHLPEEDTTFTVRVLATSTATEYTDPATPGRDDFHIATKELEFTKASARTGNIAITINDDDVVENDQTVQLEIVVADDPADDLGDHYARHATGKLATVTIEDDDRDEATVDMAYFHGSTTKFTVENQEDGTNMIVPIAISHRAQESTTFTLEVTGGSARETDDTDNSTGNPKDFVIATKTVTFAAGSARTEYVTVAIEDDRVEEDTETIEVRIMPAAASPGTVGAYSDLGNYYTRHAQGSTGTLTITDNDEVATVTLSVNREANDLDEITVLEGTLVTVTATADIPVGPRGWTVASENTWLTNPTFILVLPGACSSAGQWTGWACPNDYTLPAAFTIAEGQTTATATLRVRSDTRREDADERLGLKGTATRTTEGGTERTLTTNELDLRIRESGAGLSLGTASVTGLVPGETGTYTVALRGGAPTVDVMVTPASDDTGKATVSCAADPCALTFTPDNWDQPQEVTVTAVAAGSATITHTVSSTDSTYGALGQTGLVNVKVGTAVQNFRIQGAATGAEGEAVELTVTLGALAPTGGLELSVSRARVADSLFVGQPPQTPTPDAGLAVGDDRDSPPATLTVPAGQRSATLSDPLAADDLVEGPEHYFVTLSTIASGWTAAPSTNADDYETCDELPTCARVTIADADSDGARVWLGNAAGGPSTLYQASVAEGAGTLSVPVTVNVLPSASTTFDIEVVGSGTATEGAGGDFTIATKSVTFGPSSAKTQNVSVTINDDAAAEGAETIKLRIANPDNPADDLGDHYRRGPIGRSQATLTIADNDGSVVVSGSAVAVTRNGTVTYTLRLVGAEPGGAVVIAVASDDTTKATVSPATLSFTAANQPRTVTVTGKAVGTATISHTISTARNAYPTGLSIGSVDVTVTEQPTISLAVSPNPVPEGNSVTVTLTLSKALDVPTKTIPIVLTAGTADTGDYGALANIAVDNTGTVFRGTITTVDDADTEDETFTVALGDPLPSSVTRGTPHTATVTIQDGDTNTVSLSASSSTVGEGETVTITATLTQPLSNEIVIPLTITNGTAQDADYTAPTPRQITIAAGAGSGTYEITTVEDQEDEGNETFTVALGSPLPDAVVAGTRSVTVTIDDGEPNRVSLSAAPKRVLEGETVTITATLERALSQNAVIPVTIVNGTAEDEDYTVPAPPQITITADETSGRIVITAAEDDDASEGDETFTVALGAPLPDSVVAGTSSVEVTIRDDDASTPTGPREPTGPTGGGPSTGGGGGGGGASRAPTPSEADFEWNVSRDIDSLDRNNAAPTDLWSDGETLYVLNNAASVGDRVFAYRLDTGEREADRDSELERRNRFAQGLWSDGEVVWIADAGQDRLFAYELESGERLEDHDLELAERNRDPRGIWSDGSRFHVLDSGRDALFLYDRETGALIAELPLDKLNKSPRGIWSDGVTIWVSDDGAKRLFAYRLIEEEIEAEVEPDTGSAPVPGGDADPESAQAPGSEPETDPEIDPEPEDAQDSDGDQPESEAAAPVEIRYELVRHEAEEFTFRSLLKAANGDPRGIWSDGQVMFVADARDGRIYSYNLPAAIDARLASVTLNEVELVDFSPRELSYAVEVEHDVELATVAATPARDGAAVVIEPADADDDPENGHQVAVEDGSEVVVTVTSEDGSRTRVYTLALQRANRAPVSSDGPVVELTAGGKPAIVDLDDYFSDPDGDRLSFTVGGSSDDDVATVEAAGGMLRITPRGAGAASFEVTASDGELENEPRTIAITVEPAAAPVETPEEPSAEVGPEVRLAARPVAAGQVEFGLQERGEGSVWRERLLPRARFLPSDSEVDRWRVSSRIKVGEGEAVRTVVIAARRIASGAVEFALVIRRADDSGWSARLLPRARILRPDSESYRWRYSTPLVLGSP